MKPCPYIGCNELVIKGYCEKHQRKKEEIRGTAYKRGYDNNWKKARNSYIKRNPLCAECYKLGILMSAEVVDHIIPHRGDKKLFWDVSNWQSLCKKCHDIKTRGGG